MTLPFFDGIEYPSLATIKKQSVDDFTDFVEAPTAPDKTETKEPKPKVHQEVENPVAAAAQTVNDAGPSTTKSGNRTQLIDEAFGEIMAPAAPTAPPTAPPPAAPAPVPVATHVPELAHVQPEEPKPVPITQPSASEDSKVVATAEAEDEDEEFGDFQEPVEAPVPNAAAENIPLSPGLSEAGAAPVAPPAAKIEENSKDAPLIYRLDSDEADKAAPKQPKIEPEVVEDIVIKDDPAVNPDQVYVEQSDEAPEKFEKTSEIVKTPALEPKMAVPEPKTETKSAPTEERKGKLLDVFDDVASVGPATTKVPENPPAQNPAPAARWASLLDLDFVASSPQKISAKAEMVAMAPLATEGMKVNSGAVEQTPPPAEVVATLENVQAAQEPSANGLQDEENKEISEKDILEGFVTAFAKKEPPKDQKAAAVATVAVRKDKSESQNAFFMGQRPKPVIADSEDNLSLNAGLLKQVAEWLWYSESLENFSKLSEHLTALVEMNEYLAKKKEATVNEEFEKAIEYRNKANATKEKLLSDSEIKAMVAQETGEKSETMSELIDHVISIGDLQLVTHFFREPHHGAENE